MSNTNIVSTNNPLISEKGTYGNKNQLNTNSKKAHVGNIGNNIRNINGNNNGNNDIDLLKASLIKFFCQKENIDRFLPIIKRTSPISLRLLDYFCVNYSRCCLVVYTINNKYFDVHSSYKNQLKTHTKKMFDPFKRNTRITIRYENERFDTTLGQLCFFKWCLCNNILDYVEKNITAISDDMKKNYGNEENGDETVSNKNTAQNLGSGTGKQKNSSSGSEKKRRSSRRKSSLNFVATRVPATPGSDTVIVTFQ